MRARRLVVRFLRYAEGRFGSDLGSGGRLERFGAIQQFRGTRLWRRHRARSDWGVRSVPELFDSPFGPLRVPGLLVGVFRETLAGQNGEIARIRRIRRGNRFHRGRLFSQAGVLRFRKTTATLPAAARTASAAVAVVAFLRALVHHSLHWTQGRLRGRRGLDRDRLHGTFHCGFDRLRRGPLKTGTFKAARRVPVGLQNFLFDCARNLVVLLVVFEEVRNVEERVTVEADINKGRLHARQNARHTALVNAPSQRVLIGALKIDFDQLVVFKNGHFGFVAVSRYD